MYTRPRGGLAIISVLALLGALLVAAKVAAPARADTYPPPGEPATVSADGLPTWQINGVVWAQVVVGNTVYATGSFTKARPPGTSAGNPSEVVRNNLLAYDITTGNLITSFNHSLNGQGMAIAASPNGSRIYVGGDFTTVDGITHNKLAAFDTATGALVAGFTANVSGRVRAIAATNSTVYFGGNFFTLNGAGRTRLGAVNGSTGSSTSWAPTADDHEVWAMALAPDQSRVIVGGRFTTLNGVSAYGMGSLNATTGATLAWAANAVIRDAGPNAAITSLRADATQIYGTGYAYGGGNWEGPFAANPTTGALNWVNDCHGDTYDTFSVNQLLYSVGHAHDCAPIQGFPEVVPRVWYHATVSTNYPTTVNTGPDTYGWNWSAYQGAKNVHWYPSFGIGSYTGQYQAGWTVTGNSDYVVIGGEFPSVNGIAQQGLVRFAVGTLAPNDVAPIPTAGLTPTAVSLAGGTARVTWTPTWDKDNQDLRYDVLRDGAATPIGGFNSNSEFWLLNGLGYVDTGLTAGSTHTYKIRVTDPAGNLVGGNTSAAVTIAGGTAPSSYATTISGEPAASYWRLGESSGTGYNFIGPVDLTVNSGVTRGAAGAISGDANTAYTFNGTSSGLAVTQAKLYAPSSFSIEAWVKTTSTSGGKIVGYGSAASGSSSSYDRHIYMENSGKIRFGVYPNAIRTIVSPGSYNNGQRHHVVATLSSTAGMTLYVDGVQVASDPSTKFGQGFLGYWRIGGDNLTGWPNKPTSSYLNGTIDEVAIYSRALGAGTVTAHHAAGTGAAPPPNQPPTAAFTSSCTFLSCSFNGAGSTDSDGTVTSYAWNFGDGQTGTGSNPSHSYAAAGAYTVQLTVTDNDGATGSVSQVVNPTSPPGNTPPTAAFTSSCTFLSCNFNGTGSSDPDGTVVSYAWNFGDGQTGTGSNPSHTYAAAGAYTVQLTVTDDDGGTGSVSQVVNPTNPPAGLATDTFSRTVTGGLGTAEVGGPWTLTGTAGDFSVDGSAAKVVFPVAPTARAGYLNSVSTSGADTTITISPNKVGSGNGIYFSIVGRHLPGVGGYRGRVRFLSSGLVGLSVTRTDATTAETMLGSELTLPGVTYGPGTVLHLRVQIFGASPTTLRARAWLDGSPEPTGWQVSTTDSTAGYQTAGALGFYSYLSASATNAPVTVTIDNLSAVPTP